MAGTTEDLTQKELAVLVESGQELTSQLGLKVVLERILGRASELTSSPDSSVILYNESRKTLYFAAATGNNAEMLLSEWGQYSAKQVPVDKSTAGRVFASGQAVLENAVANDKEHYKGVDAETRAPTVSMVCVPLLVSGKSLGVVQILNKTTGDYTPRDVKVLESLAVWAAIAVRNARIFSDLLAHMGFYAAGIEAVDPVAVVAEIEREPSPELMSILFADMRGFTQLCNILSSPQAIVTHLNSFLSMLASTVLAYGGIVNKFVGDGLVALFRGADHASRAVECAFSMCERFQQLKSEWAESSNVVLSFLDIGIGIATDEVILGALGNERIRDFTVIGTAVNLAAAFEQQARDGKRILVNQLAFNAVKAQLGAFEGPSSFDLRKPGQPVAIPYKQYWLKELREPSKPRVFISHSTEDAAFVEDAVVNPLKAHQIDTWYSREDIAGGDNWVKSVREGLSQSQWMVVVVSAHSVNSEWVPQEIDLAMAFPRFHSRIIPVCVDDTEPAAVNAWLATKQSIDAQSEEVRPDVVGKLCSIIFGQAEESL